MAVAHKGSISMGMVLIPVGLYKTTVLFYNDEIAAVPKQIPKMKLDEQ